MDKHHQPPFSFLLCFCLWNGWTMSCRLMINWNVGTRGMHWFLLKTLSPLTVCVLEKFCYMTLFPESTVFSMVSTKIQSMKKQYYNILRELCYWMHCFYLPATPSCSLTVCMDQYVLAAVLHCAGLKCFENQAFFRIPKYLGKRSIVVNIELFLLLLHAWTPIIMALLISWAPYQRFSLSLWCWIAVKESVRYLPLTPSLLSLCLPFSLQSPYFKCLKPSE